MNSRGRLRNDKATLTEIIIATLIFIALVVLAWYAAGYQHMTEGDDDITKDEITEMVGDGTWPSHLNAEIEKSKLNY